MVATARVWLTPCADRARVRRADATDLPFPDDTFDAVVSFIMLHHVIDWEAAVAEAIRVLRPGAGPCCPNGALHRTGGARMIPAPLWPSGAVHGTGGNSAAMAFSTRGRFAIGIAHQSEARRRLVLIQEADVPRAADASYRARLAR